MKASLGNRTVPTRGRPAPVYDCGPHGKLTARQIAGRAGICKAAVQKRVRWGWTGEQLLWPAHESQRQRVKAAPRSDVLAVAMRLARAFPKDVPTADEIMAVRPMSRDTAIRWRRAMAMEAGRVRA